MADKKIDQAALHGLMQGTDLIQRSVEGKLDPQTAIPGTIVLFGEDEFLKHLAAKAIQKMVLGGGYAELSLTRFQGEKVEWRDIADELNTLGLFGGGRRLVWIEEAEDFITKHRPKLEAHAAQTQRSGGILLLSVDSWLSSTRLHKQLLETGAVIECKVPPIAKLMKWATWWAEHEHGVKLDGEAASILIECTNSEMGILNQELAKLAAYIGEEKKVTASIVREIVGGWRQKTTWDMLDAALAGDAPAALLQLERILLAGEHPIVVMAQIASSMRRLAAATRLIELGEDRNEKLSLRSALEQVGVKSFFMGKTEQQIRQLGRERAGAFYRMLLEADLSLKGEGELPPRLILEKLIAFMAKGKMTGSAAAS